MLSVFTDGLVEVIEFLTSFTGLVSPDVMLQVSPLNQLRSKIKVRRFHQNILVHVVVFHVIHLVQNTVATVFCMGIK